MAVLRGRRRDPQKGLLILSPCPQITPKVPCKGPSFSPVAVSRVAALTRVLMAGYIGYSGPLARVEGLKVARLLLCIGDISVPIHCHNAHMPPAAWMASGTATCTRCRDRSGRLRHVEMIIGFLREGVQAGGGYLENLKEA